MFWVMAVCHLSFVEYLIYFVYPGLSFSLIRSFIEHRPGPTNEESSVIVEAALPFQILFLNNNFHHVHHSKPWLPWYRIKDSYRRDKAEILQTNGEFKFNGYSEIASKYLFKPKDSPVHPDL